MNLDAFDSLAKLIVLAGYLLGSIPFGLVFTKAAGLGDVRKIGSGNIGATNVLRTGNKGLALATLLCDGGKGAAAVALAHLIRPDFAALAGAAAIIGHCFPVWLKFKGGKGVATFLGTLLAINALVGGIAIAAWVVMAALFRMSSLSSLAAALAGPIAAWFLADAMTVTVMAIIAAVIFVTHRANIGRILKGEEPKIGKKG